MQDSLLRLGAAGKYTIENGFSEGVDMFVMETAGKYAADAVVVSNMSR